MSTASKTSKKLGNIEEKASRAVNVVKANPNTVLIVGGVAVLAFLLYKLNRGFNSVGDKVGDIFEGDTKTGLEYNPSKPSPVISSAKANSIAEALYTLMSSFGKTDPSQIISILQGFTHNDFVKIEQAFGDKRYVKLTGKNGIWPADRYRLGEWISNEVGAAGYQKIINELPLIFR